MSETVLPQPEEPAASDQPTPAPETVKRPNGDVKELRIALVCYGGVSLAIYMHGITKEIQRAVRAAALQERGTRPDEDGPSEQAYRGILAALAGQRGASTRIVVDAIAGSSAGGINGIFLAKALVHNLNQDALRDLWFEHGDLGKIVRDPEGFWGGVERFAANRLPLGDEGSVPSRDTRQKMVGAAMHIYNESLLDGDIMSELIFEALSDMEPGKKTPASPDPLSLVPDRHLLELFVTVTDTYGYARELPITDPPVVSERQHRHLLHFSYRSDQADDFKATDNGALTLGARATSSLPVGFQPVHVGGFPAVLKNKISFDQIKNFFRAYELARAAPGWAFLMDGGILDNRPFGPVLKAIKQRPAANEVDRYLIYLEPDPHDAEAPPAPPAEPKPIPAAIAGLSGLPRSEPILDELHDLLQRNEYVRSVRDTIEANWTPVDAKVRELTDKLSETPTADELKAVSDEIHKKAVALTELAYPMYVRLKVSSAIDAFAQAACIACDYTDESNQAFLVRKLLREWARGHGYLQHEKPTTDDQLTFVRDFDLAYAERRLQFVLAGVSWLYRGVGDPGSPTRQQLDQVKERLSEAVAKLEWLSSGRGFAENVLGNVRTCFGEQRLLDYLKTHQFDTVQFLADHGQELDDLNEALRAFLDTELTGFAAGLYEDLVNLTADWPGGETRGQIRRDLLNRYLGFPIWDALLYPLQAYTDLNERDAVRVARMSPREAKLLKPTSGTTKVQGAQLGHAYAFFSAPARQNDYLWGRLDAAEAMVRLLLTTTDEQGEVILGDRHPAFRSSCKTVFQAVLTEDRAHLPEIPDTVDALADQVGKL
jgi:patatin-related protein